MKVIQRVGKYLNLVRELTVIPIIVTKLGAVHKSLEKRMDKLEIKENRDHPDTVLLQSARILRLLKTR